MEGPAGPLLFEAAWRVLGEAAAAAVVGVENVRGGRAAKWTAEERENCSMYLQP